jgi:hypothetical protein
MRTFKFALTFCATLFFTTGVIAQSEENKQKEKTTETKTIETSEVSAAYAVSLFNFISLSEEKKDTLEETSEGRYNRFFELIHAFIYENPLSFLIFS